MCVLRLLIYTYFPEPLVVIHTNHFPHICDQQLKNAFNAFFFLHRVHSVESSCEQTQLNFHTVFMLSCCVFIPLND